MKWPCFRCKKFLVEQEGVVHPVGTDAMLLGSWIVLPDSSSNPNGQPLRVLDIGTGTGIIALMLAQRLEAAQVQFTIDGLDIDAGTASCAARNFAASPWAKQMQVIATDVQDFAVQHPATYDLIVSNPPFFSSGQGSPDPMRRLGRHDDSLSAQNLLDSVQLLLADRGAFGVILPEKEAQRLAEIAVPRGLYWTATCRVAGRAGKPTERILYQFERDPMPFRWSELSVYGATGTGYSAQYRTMTEAFYL
jgi:tRNA1Val (adenine37-N6)-methyltransferase